jgi:hypothetical protein
MSKEDLIEFLKEHLKIQTECMEQHMYKIVLCIDDEPISSDYINLN